MQTTYLVHAFMALFFFNISAHGQSNYGGTSCSPNSSCYDTDYPIIKDRYAKAGVQGGIPNVTNIKSTLNPGGNIQSAINSASSSGGGVVKLNNGTYNITSTINMKDNVVLRGQSKNGVILKSKLTATWSQGKKNTIVFASDVTRAGLEDLTIEYAATSTNPVDRSSYTAPYCGACFKNDPNGKKNLYVRSVFIDGDNNWIDNCRILKSGTDPLAIYPSATHNTIRNTFVDRCYNKGPSGNGYIDIRGDDNLIVGNTFKRMRHFALHLGAKFNVVKDNTLEVDVNFHNKDDGYNLVETNSIRIPSWRGWDVFSTGGAQYGHAKPGPKNYILKNSTDYKSQGPRYANPNIIYTFTGYGSPSTTNWSMPTCNSFYAVSCGGGNPPPGGGSFVQMVKRNASGFAVDGGNGGANNRQLVLWTKNSGDNQKWEEISRGNGFYSYKKKGTNYCIDGGNGGQNNQAVKLYSCSSGNQNQHWKKISAGGGHYRLQKRNASGFSIDGGNGGAKSQKIKLYANNSSNQNQQWKFNTSSGREGEVVEEVVDVLIAFPNPVKDVVIIDVNLEEDSDITLSIIDSNGVEVVELSSGYTTAGNHQFTWDAEAATNGVFLVKLQTPFITRTTKLLVDR